MTRSAPGTLESPLLDRILARLAEFGASWSALPVGGSITLPWPLDRHGRMVGKVWPTATKACSRSGHR